MSKIILLVVAAGLLGTVGVAAALWDQVRPTSPLTITLLRLGFSAPFLCALAWPTCRSGAFRVRRAAWPLLAAMGLAMAVCQSLFFLAIPLAGVTLVVVISLCGAPLIIALLSIPLFGERLTRQVSAALALGIAGTAVLVLGGDKGGSPEARPAYLWGVLLALGSGAAYSAFMLLSKIATQSSRMTSSQITALAFSFAALWLLPFVLFSGTLQLDLPPAAWLIAAYLGLVPTALAYLLIAVAMRAASATTVSIVTLLEPAVAAFLAWWLLGERIGPLTVAGAVLLLLSVGLLSWRPPPTRRPSGSAADPRPTYRQSRSPGR